MEGLKSCFMTCQLKSDYHKWIADYVSAFGFSIAPQILELLPIVPQKSAYRMEFWWVFFYRIRDKDKIREYVKFLFGYFPRPNTEIWVDLPKKWQDQIVDFFPDPRLFVLKLFPQQVFVLVGRGSVPSQLTPENEITLYMIFSVNLFHEH